MERRLAALRQRLWRKKAALQQTDEQLVSPDLLQHPQGSAHQTRPAPQVGSVGGAPQHGAPSRVAAVGPYIQASSPGQSEDAPLKAASGESWLPQVSAV